MLQWLTGILALFIPPRDPVNNPDALYRWTIIMSASSSLLTTVFVVQFMWLSGWIPGLESKAYAEVGVIEKEIAPVKKAVFSMQKSGAKKEIIAMRERQCKADRDNNSDAKRFATNRLNDALEDYRNLTGQTYIRLPDCGELM